MSRTGPEYVESESELFSDLDRKRHAGEVSDATIDAFVDLYEFAKGLDGAVTIGEAKHANFQFRSDTHLGDYTGSSAVFTVHISGELKVWTARMPLKYNPELVGWEESDYSEYKRKFQILGGVPSDSSAVKFENFAQKAELDEFKSVVKDFLSVCEQKNPDVSKR